MLNELYFILLIFYHLSILTLLILMKILNFHL